MELINFILTIGIIVLVSGISVLSLCAVIASSHKGEKIIKTRNLQTAPNNIERRQNMNASFPITCSDGTTVYFDRRFNS